MREVINQYLETVSEQIRWKRARKSATEELEAHIEDQKRDFITGGMNEEAAEAAAVREMGDPIKVGAELDRVHRPKLEVSMLVFVGFLLGCGVYDLYLMMSQSERTIRLQSVLQIYVIAAIAAVCVYLFDYTLLLKYAVPVYTALILLSVYARCVGIYAHRYIYLLYPVALAMLLYKTRDKGIVGYIISYLCFLIQIVNAMFFSQGHSVTYVFAGGAAIITIFSVGGLFGKKGRVGYTAASLLLILLSGFAVITVLTETKPYVKQLIAAVTGPYQNNNYTDIYMLNYVRDIVRNARLIGGCDTLSGFYLLPDYLLTYILGTYGWLYVMLIIAFIAAFTVRGFVLCAKQRSVAGRITLVSVMVAYSVQSLLYILSSFGLYFYTYPLPLISYGGTSLVINMALVGLFMSAVRTDGIVRDGKTLGNFDYKKILRKIGVKLTDFGVRLTNL